MEFNFKMNVSEFEKMIRSLVPSWFEMPTISDEEAEEIVRRAASEAEKKFKKLEKNLLCYQCHSTEKKIKNTSTGKIKEIFKEEFENKICHLNGTIKNLQIANKAYRMQIESIQDRFETEIKDIAQNMHLALSIVQGMNDKIQRLERMAAYKSQPTKNGEVNDENLCREVKSEIQSGRRPEDNGSPSN